MPRVFCATALQAGQALALDAGAARHVQVLRLQPGAPLTLFDGQGGEYEAVIERIGRSEVEVRVGRHDAVEREAAREVQLAVGMPANERMDWLVEKATELGATAIWPLLAQRSVLRLSGERAAKRQAHWQSIAIAACEQCGRNRVPRVHAVMPLDQWTPPAAAAPLLLSLKAPGLPLGQAAAAAGPVLLLSGPEGGLSAQEEDAALARGFQPVSLGGRVLRAETAPLAALAVLTLTR
ncbi:MAG TPA: 16S rRNA (uracil(1498)-N(3))-methyltransferase [Ramlibacter sp.]|nr:16S rRNA (uracil(1498)-N(3))-methyltransferase [Ramlibacter sp.]